MSRRQAKPRYINKELVRAENNIELFIAALRKLGGKLAIARRMCGMETVDVEWMMAQPELKSRIDEAIRVGEDNRINVALELIEGARQSALVTQDVDDMLKVAQIVAPELAVTPYETAKAKARAENGSTASVQVNIALDNLSQRLQAALKESPANSASLAGE